VVYTVFLFLSLMAPLLHILALPSDALNSGSKNIKDPAETVMYTLHWPNPPWLEDHRCGMRPPSWEMLEAQLYLGGKKLSSFVHNRLSTHHPCN